MQAPYRVCMLALATEKSGENVDRRSFLDAYRVLLRGSHKGSFAPSVIRQTTVKRSIAHRDYYLCPWRKEKTSAIEQINDFFEGNNNVGCNN